jgi:hypothetical protein
VWNHDETIRNNIIALNRDAQVWGWFDGKDRRHWPARQAAVDAPNRPRADDIAAPYVARNRDGQPQGLTLEKLKLQFESNIYFAAPGQDAFVWGPTWTQHRRYATLAEFQAGLGIDRQSRVVDPAFANIKALDFRISRSTMPELDSRYPRGTIPGALLGVRE